MNGNKEKSATSCVGDCGHGERAVCFCGSDGDWAVAHARGGAKGSQSCREDADDDLNDGLPSFLLHSAFMLFLGVDNYGGSPAGAKPPPIA